MLTSRPYPVILRLGVAREAAARIEEMREVQFAHSAVGEVAEETALTVYHLCRKGFLGAESFPITPFGVGNSLEFASTSTQAVPTFALITVQ
jgi:hypothetical protein